MTSDFTQVQLDKEEAIARMEGKFDYSDTVGDRVNAAIDEALQRAYVAKLFDCAEYAAEDIFPLPSIRAITAKYTVLPGPDGRNGLSTILS